MTDLIKSILSTILGVFTPGVRDIVMAIVGPLIPQLDLDGNAEKALGIIADHVKRFDAAMTAARQAEPDLRAALERAARDTFELSLTRALRAAGLLKTVGK